MKHPFHFVALALGLGAHCAVMAQLAPTAGGVQRPLEAPGGFAEDAVAQAGAPVPVVLANQDASQAVTVSWNGSTHTLTNGVRTGPWTLMEVIGEGEERIAVFEDLRRENGRMVFVRSSIVVADLSKSLEPTFPLEPSKLYRGHTLNEVFDSATDLLGQEILVKPGDPEYEEVAACFPPLRRGSMTYTFVGVRENSD